MKNLPSRLKKLRESAELSFNALAERAEVSPAFIFKLEAGEYTTLSIEKSRALAHGLGMTLRDFLEEVGLLDSTETPNADIALASALRKRKLTDDQIGTVVSLVNVMSKDTKK